MRKPANTPTSMEVLLRHQGSDIICKTKKMDFRASFRVWGITWCEQTGLGTHTVNQLLQDHCKMSSGGSGYHSWPCATPRSRKTPKKAQIQATWLSSLQSSEGNAQRPGRRENRGWAGGSETSEFLPVVKHPLRHTQKPLLNLGW